MDYRPSVHDLRLPGPRSPVFGLRSTVTKVLSQFPSKVSRGPLAVDRRLYNHKMSAKRYQFKLIEAADAPELETKLREAGTRMWSAVGYGVLPDGRRSVLLERKVKMRRHSHNRDDQRASAVADDQ